MEIERKCLVKQIPENCESFPRHAAEQAYLCTGPVVRVRRGNDSYYLTYKGRGLLSREKYNLLLNEQAYRHLLAKADGIIPIKECYLTPVKSADHLTIEMGVFKDSYQDLILTGAEFSTEGEAMAFKAPEWFGRDVTFSGEFQNSRPACGDTNIPCRQV